MSRASEMQGLVDHLKVSSDCRTKAVEDIVQNTREILAKFAKDLNEMSRKLRAELAEGVATLRKNDIPRVKASKEQMAELAKESSAAKRIWLSLGKKSNKMSDFADEEMVGKKSKKQKRL